MSTTSIEWATHVWNPFTGCDRVSSGCAKCYAAETAAGNKRKELGRLAKAQREGKPLPLLRYQNDGDSKTSGPGFAFTVHQDRLDRPPRFPAGARVFVNSMSDVFHEDAPDEAVAELFDRCRQQPHANFLILTKRAERMAELVPRLYDYLEFDICEWNEDYLPNVWLGVSIENRRFVHRADVLRLVPAAVRFISAEPLLGPLVLGQCNCLVPAFEGAGQHAPGCAAVRWPDGKPWPETPELDLTDIDWLITGAESGPRRRRFDPQWARDLRDACFATSPFPPGQLRPELAPGRTAFFHKQGSHLYPGRERELDGRTWDEFPSIERRLTVG